MSIDCIIARRGSRKTVSYYVWNRYNRVSTTRYRWNRYNVNSTTTYRWNRYNVNSTTTYYWDRYNVVSTTRYTWNRYDTTAYYEIGYFEPETNYLIVLYNKNSSINAYKFEDITINTSVGIVGSNPINIKLSEVDTFNTYIVDRNKLVDPEYGNKNLYWIHLSTTSKLLLKLRAFFWDAGDPYRIGVANYGATPYWTCPRVPEYSQGAFKDTVNSTSSSTYPTDGVSGEYWYVYDGSNTTYSQGSTSYSQVSSTSSSAYPNDGYSGEYWYVYDRQQTSYSQGSANGSVSSTNRSAYPDNNYSGNYWYVYDTSNTTYSKGSANGSVTSTNRTQYPDNGRSGSYWYVYSTSSVSYSRGSYIDQVTSSDRNSFPDNNYSGNYWYVYQGTAEEVVTNQASLNSILSD